MRRVDRLDEAERHQLILSYVESCNAAGHGAQEADIAQVVAWAEDVRNEAAFLELVLAGLMAVVPDPEGVRFYLTAAGRRWARAEVKPANETGPVAPH